jgi:predicted transcriptional regulator
MNATAKQLAKVVKLDPREAAAQLAAAQREGSAWLDEFAEHLDRHRAGQSLARTLAVWGLSQSQLADYFGVSRQAVNKWIEQGIPAERLETLADLAAATDLLVHYLQRDRIAAVVRRPIPALERSLLDLLAAGETRLLLQTCRDMFDFERVQS